MLRKIGLILLIILACVGVAGMCFGVINNIRSTNPDNIINVENYDEGLTAEREDGITVSTSDDGQITVKGKNEAETDVEIKVCDVTLAKGEYTISSSAKGVANDTYYLCLRTGEGESAVTTLADTADKSTITVEADDTVYTVYIVICAGAEIDTTFKPVLVSGAEAGSFYVYGK
ncbi:MAG: hypothetical protein IJ039_04505 [Clostridia bacterium]|nr:hypothetical protein [Clostridia bacterium]